MTESSEPGATPPVPCQNQIQQCVGAFGIKSKTKFKTNERGTEQKQSLGQQLLKKKTKNNSETRMTAGILKQDPNT